MRVCKSKPRGMAGHASGCWCSALGAGVPYNREKNESLIYNKYINKNLSHSKYQTYQKCDLRLCANSCM